MIVMDPLAAPLSCPCVKGYAQRDYQRLADYLSRKLGRTVDLEFAESLAKGMEKLGGRADLVIGKRSVVVADAQRARLKLQPLAALGNKDGSLYQTGLLVVRGDSPAQTPADLKGYRIILGPADCDEKHAAARELLARHAVPLPEKVEVAAACSDGATIVVEAGPTGNVATVISSYAQPLLEGCGTIKRGDLRVIGETAPVPFIVAFAADGLVDLPQIKEALLATPREPLIRLALESKQAFVPEPDPTRPPLEPEEKSPGSETAWLGWRGRHRDARVAYLPDSLDRAPAAVWQYPLSCPGLGGIGATHHYVLVSDRDPLDQFDVFTCLHATNGTRLWSVRYLAPGRLDYGNSPRATPLVDGDRAFFLGAFGHLHAVELATGKVLWKKNLRSEFGADDRLVWGVCSSPLISEGLLIVNPGGRNASLAALDPKSGRIVWQTPGRPAAFASFIERKVGTVTQLIGYDKETLGGWDARTGARLWEVRPDVKGDFNVPTPVLAGDRLFVTTENNGGRLFAFDAAGQVAADPVATCDDLAHDMHTPVVVGDRLLAVSQGLHCVDARTLQSLWFEDDPAFREYAALIASPRRVLAVSQDGELLLLDPLADRPRIVSRWRLTEDKVSVLSHPALVGTQLFVRLGNSLICFSLA
jgi:outer membrane protein assembly factor BamB